MEENKNIDDCLSLITNEEPQDIPTLDPEENVESPETDQDPFNPEDISIDTKVFTLDNLLSKIECGMLNLNPDFQRNEVWTPIKKSQLIESLMLMIPIPMFYVSSDAFGTLSVVDGVQRLSTIRDFVLGQDYLKTLTEENPEGDITLKGMGFKLRQLEFWTKYEGMNFKDLPPMLKNRIRDTNFQFTIINPGTPEEVKRNIFKRINTGGMPLSSQEIRNAIYIGKATDLLNRLVADEAFEMATGESLKKAKRMEDRELALRLVSFLIRKYSDYKRTVGIDAWLGHTMIILNAMPKLDIRDYLKFLKTRGANDHKSIHIMSDEEICDFFHTAMVRCHEVFGEHAFRKSHDYERRSPINRCLFETWGNILGGLTPSQYQNLLAHKNHFLYDYYKLLGDTDFLRTITTDSMKHTAVKQRFNTLLDITELHAGL